jgi:predicted HAD superfamily Cof-like phosphohydrolase
VSDEQAKVRQFMVDVKDLELPRQPTIPSEIVRNLCRALICEELAEVELAVAHKDIVEVAHELTDLLYVCYYMANAYGIYIDPIFDAIHQANMAKAGGPKLENGKQTKGPNYVKPNIKALIEVQLHD